MQQYYGRKGTIYRLDKLLGSGGEGDVYTISGCPDSVAKIYKGNRVSTASDRQELRDKIDAMLDINFNPRIQGKLLVAWPEDILMDDTNTFVGYVMPKVSNRKSLIWATRESDRNILFNNQYHWRLSVAIAYNLCMTVEVLHRNGIVIGDMNPNNILIDNKGNVTLIDADSFNVTAPNGRIFKCSVGMDEVLPAELQGKDLTDSKNRFTMKTDCFALAIHVFNLLCNNCHPFGCLDHNSGKSSSSKSGRIQNILKGYCPYVTGTTGKVSDTAPDMEMLPLKIRALFDRAFSYTAETAVKKNTIDARPSAREWREALGELYNGNIIKCDINSLHEYPGHYTKGCPWCVIENRTRQITQSTPQPLPPITPDPPLHPTNRSPALLFLYSILTGCIGGIWPTEPFYTIINNKFDYYFGRDEAIIILLFSGLISGFWIASKACQRYKKTTNPGGWLLVSLLSPILGWILGGAAVVALFLAGNIAIVVIAIVLIVLIAGAISSIQG